MIWRFLIPYHYATVPVSSTTLYCHYPTVPPHFTITVTLCNCFTVPPYFTVTWHCYTFLLLWHTLLSPRLLATVSPLFTITVTLVPLFHRTLLSKWHMFHHTLLLLWHRLCHYTTVVPLFTITATICHSVPPHFTITIPLFHHILLSLWLCATWQGIVIGLSPILGRPLLIFHSPDALACAADVI